MLNSWPGERINMCGIFGITGAGKPFDPDKLGVPSVTPELAHRGPDDCGFHLGFNIYLAHRRLSIIDLSTGKQPIYNEDRSKCVIFNGEIYNFHALREELAGFGHTFITHTDTEVIIHAYEEWGEKCVERFRGMFAFAIWDENEQSLFLGRDRLGIKPLFYALYEGVFYFASEMKSILQYDHFPRQMDHNALACYFTLSYIPVPLTIYKDIHKLPPGTTLTLRNGNIQINEYWDISFAPDYSKSEGYFIDGIMSHFEDAVRLRMISDVPVGAFLSGGIDSGAIVAMMSKVSSDPVHAFCMGFGGDVGGYLDERQYARQVADRYGALYQSEEVLPNLHGIVGKIVRSFDEPFADHSTIPSWYLCEMARKEVTVALSGLGGDELFGGYERYLGFRLSRIYNKLPFFLREKMIRAVVKRLPERTDGHYTVNHLKRFVRSASLPDGERYLGFMSLLGKTGNQSLFRQPDTFKESFEYCQELMLNIFNTAKADDSLDKVFYCDIKTYLPEDILALTDRMSMQHSLEVRVPFLDHVLMEFAATIPPEMKVTLRGEKKYILKKAVGDILPREVITHRKQGFEGPMVRWLQTDLKEYVRRTLSEDNLNRHGLFDNGAVQGILDDHFSRTEINDTLIWSLVVFQEWYNEYMVR